MVSVKIKRNILRRCFESPTISLAAVLSSHCVIRNRCTRVGVAILTPFTILSKLNEEDFTKAFPHFEALHIEI